MRIAFKFGHGTRFKIPTLKLKISSFVSHPFSSGLETHVFFELGKVGFKGNHFLVQMFSVISQRRIVCLTCNAAGESSDGCYAVTKIMGGLH